MFLLESQIKQYLDVSSKKQTQEFVQSHTCRWPTVMADHPDQYVSAVIGALYDSQIALYQKEQRVLGSIIFNSQIHQPIAASFCRSPHCQTVWRILEATRTAERFCVWKRSHASRRRRLGSAALAMQSNHLVSPDDLPQLPLWGGAVALKAFVCYQFASLC